jgi:hypothetical protein
MEVSILCDRKNTNINKTQVGFINFIVKPSFKTLNDLSPELKRFLDLINLNLSKYKKLSILEDGGVIDEYPNETENIDS